MVGIWVFCDKLSSLLSAVCFCKLPLKKVVGEDKDEVVVKTLSLPVSKTYVGQH